LLDKAFIPLYKKFHNRFLR